MPPAKKVPAAGGGNILTKKLGPLPGWGWLAVIVVGYLIYRHYNSGSSSTTDTTAAPTTTPTETIQTPGGTYTGPPGGAPSSITSPSSSSPGGNGGTPGQGGHTPGNGNPQPGNGNAPAGIPGITEVASAQTVQADITAGIPTYYNAPGVAPTAANPGQLITQPGGPGGEWYAGGTPLPPGAGGTVWTTTPAPVKTATGSRKR